MTSLILVYDADSGWRALALDVAKKWLGREDCSLCAITHGPLGPRGEWVACQARIGLSFEALHRDELPRQWHIAMHNLPCILVRRGDRTPELLLDREDIAACGGQATELELRIQSALSAGPSPRPPA